jgi:hypothetical protein
VFPSSSPTSKQRYNIDGIKKERNKKKKNERENLLAGL